MGVVTGKRQFSWLSAFAWLLVRYNTLECKISYRGRFLAHSIVRKMNYNNNNHFRWKYISNIHIFNCPSRLTAIARQFNKKKICVRAEWMAMKRFHQFDKNVRTGHWSRVSLSLHQPKPLAIRTTMSVNSTICNFLHMIVSVVCLLFFSLSCFAAISNFTNVPSPIFSSHAMPLCSFELLYILYRFVYLKCIKN